MPTANLVLMLLIGIVFGGISAVILRGRTIVFVINIFLGVVGASLGAFFPVLLNPEASIDVSNYNYLLRALMGAFLLVFVASLFRSAKPTNLH